MFRTAEAAGWTLNLLPEARYKTSFYSMLGGVGQTESRGRFRPVSGDVGALAAERQKNIAHGVSRGSRAIGVGAPKGRKSHESQR